MVIKSTRRVENRNRRRRNYLTEMTEPNSSRAKQILNNTIEGERERRQEGGQTTRHITVSLPLACLIFASYSIHVVSFAFSECLVMIASPPRRPPVLGA